MSIQPVIPDNERVDTQKDGTPQSGVLPVNRNGFFLLLAALALTACEPGANDPASPGRQQEPDRAVPFQDAAGAGNANAASPSFEHSDQPGSDPVALEAQSVKPNVIRWSTASEHDSFGYDIYRGDSEEGPFQVINPEVIPGAGTTDMPSRYEFVDGAVEPDTTYWYFIESISLTGERKRITPVYPSKPKPETPSGD